MTRKIISFRFDERVIRELDGVRNRSRMVEQLVVDGMNRKRLKGEAGAWYLVVAVGVLMSLGAIIT